MLRQRPSTVTGLFCFETRIFFKLKILFSLISTGKESNLAKNCSNFILKETKLILRKENNRLSRTTGNFRFGTLRKNFDNETLLNKHFLRRPIFKTRGDRFPVGLKAACRRLGLKGTACRRLGVKGTPKRSLEFDTLLISL